jgi:Beta-lactamase superfamily domain
VPGVRLTHIGGPTALIEVGGWRLLTDPTFDAPGRRYKFGWGTSSRKTGGPALQPGDLGRIDVVLLSHDHHGDNLDDAGRALLPSAGTAIPIHYEGWAHFQETREEIEREFEGAPEDVRRAIRWVPIGEPVELAMAAA